MEIDRHPFPMQRTHTAPVDSAAFTASHAGRRPQNMTAAGAPGPAGRTSTSTTHTSVHSNLAYSQAHNSSNYSIFSQAGSRSSDATQATAHSILFPPTPAPATTPSPSVGEVTATDNIMNSVADASSSLFQICVALRKRLHSVPSFADALTAEEAEADDDTDPVTLLWNFLRYGQPLLQLYNELQPATLLELPSSVKADKRPKAATIKFLQACIVNLKFPQEECFILNDLYGSDTTGFVKVAKVVNRVLDILVQRGLIEDSRPTAADFEQAEQGIKRTQRQHIVAELVTTERTYVQHLELLQAFKQLVEQRGIISRDAVHDIFFNLNALLDTQRRFLIRVEQTNAMPEAEQNWGRLFMLYANSFGVYEEYIANQRRCERMVVEQFSKLKEAGGSVEMRQMVESSTNLYGFCMKPFQRLSKYPLLLDDLYKKGDLDEQRKADLLLGKEAATSVLARTNRAVDREEKAEAVQELKQRVDDWKGHRVETFGELLLYGNFTVVKSESANPGKDGERQYHVYLFETILLCCKDIDLSKPKNKLSNRQLTDKRGKPKLQLKGRIFMQNVTDLVSLAKPGSYTCQIFWKGDPSIENFIIRFSTEDTMRKWYQQVDTQRRKHNDRSRHNSGGRGYGTSATEFLFMQNQQGMENPYARYQAEDDEDDSDAVADGAHGQHYDLAQSRNGSQTSLRSRSTLGDSGSSSIPSSTARMPPRLPPGSLQGQAQLSLRTRELLAQSPAGMPPSESYFSPTDNSPLSSSVRTSTSSTSMYPFPRQAVPPNGYYEESGPPPNNARFTAPAVARSRQVSGTPPDTHPAGMRASERPPLMHSAQGMPAAARNRSLSSPNIHHAIRAAAAASQPPVPDLPASYLQNQHIIQRSQTNSPSVPNGARTSHQSPHSQRERSHAGVRPATSHSPEDSPVDARTSTHAPARPGSRTVTPVTTHAMAPPPPRDAQSVAGPALVAGPVTSSQVRLKVHCPSASTVLTLVVPLNISYGSLRDRIDAKLQRSTNLSLISERAPKDCQVKLKYRDDGDLVSIQSDEDVATAFETWAEQRGEDIAGIGEIELWCQR